MAAPEEIKGMERLETIADVKELCSLDKPAYTLHLDTHHSGLELWGSIKPKQKGDVMREKDLLAIFKEYGVTGELVRENFKLFCAKACLGQEQHDVLLAQGKAPVKGKDERVEFFVMPSSNKPKYDVDSQGNVDNYNLHFFENAYPKQLICQTRLPEEGIAGISVTGQVIPAQKGLPFDAPPREGKDVRMEKEGSIYKFYARMAGRIVFENNEISISDYYLIAGNVGFETGHIDFGGTVEVKGDVVSDFNVIGRKGVIIKGNVGACLIESDADITIGGVSGDEKALIRCGGNLTARFINGATVECKGNMTIKNELVNCNTKCSGIIDVNLGAIVGGETMALAGIEARMIGSELGWKTIVHCGTCFIAEAKKANLNHKLESIEKQIEKIGKKLDPVIKNPKVMMIFSENDKEIIRELADIFGKLTLLRDKLLAEIHEIEKEAASRANPIINARKNLERGVEIIIGATKEFITQTIERPVTIIRNSRTARLRFIPLHPITDKAAIIDRELLKQEEEEAKKAREKALKEKRDS